MKKKFIWCLSKKECQAKCWKSCHKKLCSQSKTLLDLAALPRHEIKEPEMISFEELGDDYVLPDTHQRLSKSGFFSLPEYKFDAKFVQSPTDPIIK